jgi:tetratricopeptide (TPR) repeat protein
MQLAAEDRLQAAAAVEAEGDTKQARQAYLAILADNPDHAGALLHLGALLFRTGYSTAARSAFARVAARHPEHPHGHVKLAHLLREDGDLAAAGRHYRAALRLVPDLAEAHQGLGNVLFDLGDTAGAEQHWTLGYRDRVFAHWPYRGTAPPIRVLLLGSVRGGNLPAFPLLDQTVFAVTTVAMEYFSTSMALPAHDIVFNAIGDADLCRPALLAAAALLACTTAPAVNPPGPVLASGRIDNARRLAGLAGVLVPQMRLWPRAALPADPEVGWPLLLRAPGFHTGRHFVRVDGPGDVAAALASLPGEEVLVIDYAGPATADGFFRKFRVMRVDGVLYPLHLAISRDWKVHYFTAAMAENADFRAEEARFLADMPAFLGADALTALASIFDVLALDYAGIDFALAPDGRVVLFEANATMAIVTPTPEPIWDYRRPAVGNVIAATVAMLRRRSAAPRA